MKRRMKFPVLSRALEIESRLEPIDRAADGKRPQYQMSFSSEFPVQRWFGEEVLLHTPQAVDLNRAKRGLSIRDGHEGDVVGIAENVRLEGGRMVGDVTFSENARAQEIERDMTSDPPIRRFVSARYNPVRARLAQKGEKGKPDRFEVTRWAPVHAAIVSDPADYTVGPGRSEPENEYLFEVEIDDGDRAVEERAMPCKTCKKDPCACDDTTRAQGAADRSEGEGQAPAKKKGAGARSRRRDDDDDDDEGGVITLKEDRAERAKEIAEVVRLCQSHGVSDKAAGFIERQLSAAEVSQEILKGMRDSGAGGRESNSEKVDVPSMLSLSKKDAKRYSYSRAILAMDGTKFDGLEREVHDEISKNLPASYRSRSGVLVPMALRHEMDQAQVLQRALEVFFTGKDPMRDRAALDSKTGTGATELVFDQPGGLIPLLRNNTVLLRSGVQLLTGLTAPIAFAKQTGAMTASWVGENSGTDVTETELTTGIVVLAPKTLQATTAFSRQLLQLANEDAEAMVRRDLVNVHAIAIDRAGYHGKGAAGEPMGVYYAPDVIAKAISGGGSWQIVVDMIAQCADQNALDGTLSWVAQTLLAGRYMTIPKVSAQANFLWEGNVQEGVMAGYPARSTSQLSKVMNGSDPTGGSSYGVLFGNWADMILGMWGAMEMIPDPYAKKKQGLIELTSFQMVDVLLRHGQSFVKGTGATLA